MTGRHPRSEDRANALFTALLTINSRLKSSGMSVFGLLGLGHLDARIIVSLGKKPGATRAKLATRLSVDPAAVSRAIKSLQQRGLICADQNLRLTLTDAGADLRSEVARLVDARFERLTRTFTDSDIGQLSDLLEKLQRNLPALFDLTDVLGPAPLADGPAAAYTRNSSKPPLRELETA